jgi:DNA-binding GntR family transcriptional regulator
MISPKIVLDVYMTRKILEPGIIRQMGQGISREKLLQIKAQNDIDIQDKALDEVINIDDALHREIVCSTNNQYIIDVFNQLCDQKKRINIMSGAVSGKHMNNVEEHNAIIELLLAEDYEGAAVRMEQHLEDALQQAMNQFLYR